MCFVPTQPADACRHLVPRTTRRTRPAPRTRLTFSLFYLKLFGCHITLSGFPPSFQLVTVSPLVRNTNCIPHLLTFGEDVFAPVQTENAPLPSSERQLRSLIESYVLASLRYAAAGGMRSFQAASLPSRAPAPESREKASWEKQNVTVATVLTCGGQTDDVMRRALTLP